MDGEADESFCTSIEREKHYNCSGAASTHLVDDVGVGREPVENLTQRSDIEKPGGDNDGGLTCEVGVA